MSVPDFQTLMLPVLKHFADGAERRSADVRAPLAAEFALTPDEIAQRFERGVQTVFGNRIAWAIVYLRRAMLLESPRRGVYAITQRGRDVLKETPARIDSDYLTRFSEFTSPQAAGVLPSLKSTDPGLLKIMTEGLSPLIDSRVLTPDEQIHIGAARLKEHLVAQLLERVKKGTPAAFERLVVNLLVKMGYGGSYADAAQVVGKSGDGGIDGIIKEDRLGLESIYVQAKRWEATVGGPDIRQFAGALHGKRARKGVLITTSSFSRDALEYAKTSQIAIVLIDGLQLADFMIEFGVGVSDVETIKIKRLDEDYFAEEVGE
jgi:restriction system protein